MLQKLETHSMMWSDANSPPLQAVSGQKPQDVDIHLQQVQDDLHQLWGKRNTTL